jgi:hypothetical protein
VVYAPYCTADVFLGDATTEYAPGLTVQHKGSANGTAALDELVERFPGATDVVVIGDGHTALTEDELYTEEVGGEALLDWVTRLAVGEPVTGVHCTECD